MIECSAGGQKGAILTHPGGADTHIGWREFPVEE
jgi:hypothetical protein